MKIDVLYPSGDNRSYKGTWVGPCQANDKDEESQAILINSDEDGLAILCDPRGVYINAETKEVLYQPRGSWYHNLAKTWKDLLNEIPEWPPSEYRTLEHDSFDVSANVRFLGGDLSPSGAIEIRNSLIWMFTDHKDRIVQLSNWKQYENTDANNWLSRRLDLIASQMAGALKISDIVIWENNLWDSAHKNSEAIEGSILEEFEIPLAPQLWLTKNVMHTNSNPDNDEGQLDIVGTVLLPTSYSVGLDSNNKFVEGKHSNSKGVTICLMVRPSYKDGQSSDDMFPRITLVPCIWSGETIPERLGYYFCGLKFLSLPIVGFKTAKYSRHENRRAKKNNENLPDVRTVILRREKHRDDSSKESVSIDWSCQWVCRGHWRRQYIPGQNERRPTFIPSHIKGPEDKPLRPPRESIFLVKR
jgi:hypothetical protein